MRVPPEQALFRSRTSSLPAAQVYRPQTEHLGNYVPTILPMRYDAFLFVDRTHAVRPLFPPELSEEPPGKVKEPPETFPSGM